MRYKFSSRYNFIWDFGNKSSVFNEFFQEFVEHKVSDDGKGEPFGEGELKGFQDRGKVRNVDFVIFQEFDFEFASSRVLGLNWGLGKLLVESVHVMVLDNMVHEWIKRGGRLKIRHIRRVVEIDAIVNT